MYSFNTKYVDTDTAELVGAQSTLYILKVYGTFVYYAIVIYQTTLLDLTTISTAQSHSTTTTIGDIMWFLKYTATNPDATRNHRASYIILHIASNAFYICEERAQSRYGGHFFHRLPTRQKWRQTIHPPLQQQRYSWPVTSNQDFHALSSRAKIGATLLNAKCALPICTKLEELGHVQPLTQIQFSNTTSVGFSNNTIKQKFSKAINICFYLIRYFIL